MLIGLPAAWQGPPIVTEAGPGVELATWTAGPARCGDTALRWRRAPDPAGFVTYGGLAGAQAEPSYTFTVAADGRLLDISRVGPGYIANGEDLAPSLAAARAEPGARQGCTIRFSTAHEPVATAPMARIFAVAGRARGTLPAPLLARIKEAAGDCFAPAPQLRERAFPDFKALPQLPGATSWTATRFDLDANGRPVRVATAASSGNLALDRAAEDALRRSRFEAGVRHGCLFPTGQRAGTLEAPPAPEEAALKPAGATCPDHLPYVRQPSLTMPEPYRRRSIEGWAVVAYDVAPWGATGNLRVLAAEPAADFGEWALNVVRGATKPASSTGYVGCVDRVRFKIGDEAKLLVGGEEAPPSPPPPSVF